jgi:hypothetical protein
VTWRAISAPVAVIPMKTGPIHCRMAALVFSPSAVCASSQMTIVYASETLPALRTNHWYVSTVTGPPAGGSSEPFFNRAPAMRLR